MCNVLRKAVKDSLRQIIEIADDPARMIAFSYGQKYSDMVCAIFPSKKGAKLSFYNGINLADEYQLLEGKARTTRYISFSANHKIDEKIIRYYLDQGNQMYLQSTKK